MRLFLALVILFFTVGSAQADSIKLKYRPDRGNESRFTAHRNESSSKNTRSKRNNRSGAPNTPDSANQSEENETINFEAPDRNLRLKTFGQNTTFNNLSFNNFSETGTDFQRTPAPISEPGTLFLIGAGMLYIGGVLRRRIQS